MDEHNVTEFEVIDHGEDSSQYFPGCGTALTSFDHVATGVGDTGAEALEDAFEMMSQDDALLTTKQEEEAFAMLYCPHRSAFDKLDHSACDEDHSDDDWHHYVSVRYNVRNEG